MADRSRRHRRAAQSAAQARFGRAALSRGLSAPPDLRRDRLYVLAGGLRKQAGGAAAAPFCLPRPPLFNTKMNAPSRRLPPFLLGVLPGSTKPLKPFPALP